MIAFVFLCSVSLLFCFSFYSAQAGREQLIRISAFLTLTDEHDGRLLPQFEPKQINDDDKATYLASTEYADMFLSPLKNMKLSHKAALIRSNTK